MDNLLRPSLKFISKLPTIKLKEVVKTFKRVIWEVELDKPVNIITDYKTIRNLNTFCIEARTLKVIKESGWKYSLEICITRSKDDVGRIIDLHEEDWYLKNTWWEWYKPRPALLA